jgi:hypothetical protein
MNNSTRRINLSQSRRSGKSLALGASVAVLIAGLALSAPGINNAQPATADAAVPLPPDTLAGVNMDQLETAPVKQWGVEGTGVTYLATKPKVWDIAEINNTIYVAGTFTGVRQNAAAALQPRAYLAAFDRDSGNWISGFAPTVDRSVYTLEVAANGKLLIGGEFTTVNGEARKGLAMIDPLTGATDPTFRATIDATDKPMVREIVRVGNQVYIAGRFYRVKVAANSYWVSNMARLNGATGGIDGSFVPRFAGGVQDLVLDPTRQRISAVGSFTSLDSQPGTARFATVTAATGAYIPGLAPLEYNTTGQRDQASIAFANDRIWVGGAQHVIQILNPDTHVREGFNTYGINCNTFFMGAGCGFTAGGDVQTMEATANGQVIQGNHDWGTAVNVHYSSYTNARTNNRQATAYSAATKAPSSAWSPGLSPSTYGIWAIHVDSRGCLYLGGNFSSTSTGEWVRSFARFCNPVAQPNALTATGTSTGARVTWQAATSQLPILRYKMYRNGVFAGDTTGLSYGFPALPLGSTQEFTVRAQDVTGRLSAPLSAIAIVGGDTTPPAAVAPTAQLSLPSVVLNWAASSDNVAVTGYRVLRNGQEIATLPSTTLQYVDLAVSGAHTYTVTAVDAAGNASLPGSVTIDVGDIEAPAVPTGLTLTVVGSDVVATWAPSQDMPLVGGTGVARYQLTPAGRPTVNVAHPGTSFTETNPGSGTQTYSLVAVDQAGNQSAAVLASVVVP